MDAAETLYGTKPKDKTAELLKSQAFHEVKNNTPSRVLRTQRKKGKKAAEKQKVAIALDKARHRGANIPK